MAFAYLPFSCTVGLILWLLRLADMAFHARTAITAPANGPTTMIQKSPHASGENRAGPKLLAGLTEQLSTGNTDYIDQTECYAYGYAGKAAKP